MTATPARFRDDRPSPALRRAILARAGPLSAFALAVGHQHPVLHRWLYGHRVPAEGTLARLALAAGLTPEEYGRLACEGIGPPP